MKCCNENATLVNIEFFDPLPGCVSAFFNTFFNCRRSSKTGGTFILLIRTACIYITSHLARLLLKVQMESGWDKDAEHSSKKKNDSKIGGFFISTFLAEHVSDHSMPRTISMSRIRRVSLINFKQFDILILMCNVRLIKRGNAAPCSGVWLHATSLFRNDDSLLLIRVNESK